MKLEDFLKRTDELILHANKALDTRKGSEDVSNVDTGLFRGLRASCLAFLIKLFGKDHPFFTDFNERVTAEIAYDVEQAIGILGAVKDELHSGWFQSTKGLISADIFSDFLEMAYYFLEEGYKDPSAVIIGSVLEEHLRNLCVKFKIDIQVQKGNKVIPKKASIMNADLTKADVYNKLDEKNVTAWLHLRNKAAHGKYDEYTKEQVNLQYSAVSDFITRVPI